MARYTVVQFFRGHGVDGPDHLNSQNQPLFKMFNVSLSETTSHVAGLSLGLVQLEAKIKTEVKHPKPRPVEFGLETKAKP